MPNARQHPNRLPSRHLIARLRAEIGRIENRPAFSATGPLAGNAFPLAGVPAGSLSEIWGESYRDMGAMLGFTLLQARQLVDPARPALFWLQLAHEAQETGLPYGAGLAGLGLDPAQVVLGRMARIEDLLWAAEEALACRAVAAVIADLGRPHRLFDFTASRRLSLRAEASGVALFVLRCARAREASAAHLRWQVMPEQSAPTPFDARAPGRARWQVRLEKGGETMTGQRHWILDWTANGFSISDPDGTNRRGPAAGAPLSGAPSAVLGHRLPETA